MHKAALPPGVKNFFENLLTTEDGTTQIFLLPIGPELKGLTFKGIARKCIQKNAPFIVMGYIMVFPKLGASEGSKNMITNIFIVNPWAGGKNLPLSESDKLIVIAYETPADIADYVHDKR